MNATYTCNGQTYPTRVALTGRRLELSLQEGPVQRTVYWHYQHIRPAERPGLFLYNDYPPQQLELLDHELATRLRQVLNQPLRRQQERLGPLAKLLALFLAIALLLYFLVVPWLAGAIAGHFPKAYEQELGDKLYRSMRSTWRVDTAASRAINAFYRELHFPATYPVRITVVHDEVANAFALPGGNIVVYSKLLRGINSYDELAALLAHESVHVEQRHTVKTVARQLGGTLLLSLLIGDAGAVSTVLLGNANELKNLSYSRSLETEADREGARWLAQRGISCQGFVRLFRLLEQQSPGVQPSEWLSSHPDLRKRARAIAGNKACAGQPNPIDPALKGRFLALKTAG